MTNQGDQLEQEGYAILKKIGLTCVRSNKQALLAAINPQGSFGRDDHLEFDYLISYGDTCLIGEITGRTNESSVKSKYDKFRNQLNVLRSAPMRDGLWELLGVPENKRRYFRGVSKFKGFFILNSLQQFDVQLTPSQDIATFYQSDWQVIDEYSQFIGEFAQPLFLRLFGLQYKPSSGGLMINKENNGLWREANKKITGGDTGLADLYTFEVSPYELLPMARVFRRDMLPDLEAASQKKYQRPLLLKKLQSIREKLLTDADFMFPNNILLVLANSCRYLADDEQLNMPDAYGSVYVIDGQHRLFSYADPNVKKVAHDHKIMVTAIHFKDAGDELVNRYSARTFIEINTNQTKVASTHLDSIAYQVLGVTEPKALAAQVILDLNEKSGRMRGFFQTSQTNLGLFPTSTIMVSLRPITSLDTIASLKDAQRGSGVKRRTGYESLLVLADISELSHPQVLIDKTVACLGRYANCLAKTFPNDWPERGKKCPSSLAYAKFLAAFIRLLNQFISDGLTWQEVEQQLAAIRTNVVQLRNLTDANQIIFDPNDQLIPNSQPSVSKNLQFLNANRITPTSIADIV